MVIYSRQDLPNKKMCMFLGWIEIILKYYQKCSTEIVAGVTKIRTWEEILQWFIPELKRFG
jgi:hypothetical protein